MRDACNIPGPETNVQSPGRCPQGFGFFCRNPLQAGRILDLARTLERSCIVIGQGKRGIFGSRDPVLDFEEIFFTDAGVPILVWPERRLLELDGFFDIIVCQAGFPGMHDMKKSRIVSIQSDGEGNLQPGNDAAQAGHIDPVEGELQEPRLMVDYLMNLALEK